MMLIGLTGGIATGKSTASSMFQSLGVPVIDADKIARKVVEPGTLGSRKIRKQFGSSVFHSNGELDRELMAEIIFSDATKRKMLNSITHPEIFKTMVWDALMYFLKGEQFIILDLPLMFETNSFLPFLSETIVVTCNEENQLARLKARNGYTDEEAKNRIESQMPLEEKCRKATHVIDNNNSIELTEEQVNKLFKMFRNSNKHLYIRFGVLGIVSFLLFVIVWACFHK